MAFLTRILPFFGLLIPCALPAMAQETTPEPPTAEALNLRFQSLSGKRPSDPQNAALYAYKMEQAELLLNEIRRYTGWAPTDYLKATDTFLKRAAEVGTATGDAAVDPKLLLQERAYLAENDGSAQPYWVALPPGYSPTKRWPLLVFLHGYSTDVSKLNPWMPPIEVIQAAQKRGFILAIPYGRRNTDFVQVGEDDLLTVRREVERIYSVDHTRVFLTGASMGGYGVWAAGLHTAGQWAALTPICGRTDFYLWFKQERNQLPTWKQLLFDADDPRTLLPNLRGFPVYVQHGANDNTVPVEHSRRIAADAKPLNLPLFYREDPKGDHYSEFQIAAFESAFQWMSGVRQLPPPREFSVVSGDLKEARGHWAKIEAFEDYGRMARLDVAVKDGSTIEVRTNNVARFVLEPPTTVLKPGRLLTLKVNGLETPQLLDPIKPIVWDKPTAKLGKSPTACGPYKNAFRDKFFLVYGNDDDKIAAERFRAEWWVYADGWPTIKAANQVTETEKTDSNLILFGTAASNTLLSEFANEMPLELTSEGYRMGNQNFPGKNFGLRLVWQSPWNPKRLVTIQSGTWWGQGLPPNHRWDLIPDYIVYTDELEADGTNKAVTAGYFDGNWNLPKTAE